MRILLVQIDGKLPNLALMRIAAYHRSKGDEVELQRGFAGRSIWDRPDRVYASAIFARSRPLADRLKAEFPGAVLGGTGIDPAISLASAGIPDGPLDYSLYPHFKVSLGFTQRGCRLSCKFCVVPAKEGHNQAVAAIHEIWRGEPWPREVLLLDNDFFGQPTWRERIVEIRDGGFKVCFTQGVNLRILTQEQAEALASVDYRDDSMKVRRLYTAWDNPKDERSFFRGLQMLIDAGVKPDSVMVYMLVGYDPAETENDRLFRQARLREWGCRPYPMPFQRTRELIGFQRWVIGAYDKRFSWSQWKKAGFRPERLGTLRQANQNLELGFEQTLDSIGDQPSIAAIAVD